MAQKIDFSADGCRAQDSVYLELPGGGKFVEIFLTSASDTESVSIIGSPGERGNKIYDHRVLQPASVHVEGWVSREYYDVLSGISETTTKSQLKDAVFSFYNRDQVPFENLVITKMTVKATSDKLNLLFVSIDLQEFMQN